MNHGDKISITDRNGEQHEVEIENIDGAGWNWRLVCTNSGEELVRGESHRDELSDSIYVEIHNYACVFEQSTLELELNVAINEAELVDFLTARIDP